MDPDKPCMPDRKVMSKSVPKWKRDEKWGFSAEEMALKKKATGAKYAGDASERRVPEADDTEGGRTNAAGHFVPAWYLRIAPGGFESWVPSSPGGGQVSTRIPLTQDA